MIVNSEATREALYAYADARGLAVPPCVIAPLAPSSLPVPVNKRPLDQPYFVVLGTVEPRKNHLLLLHLWRQLRGEFGDQVPHLVIIGQRGWECEQVVDLLERCQAMQGVVVEKSHCDDLELATWLYHAQALLFPSFTEGFGIPLVEALMLGVPVIASNLPVFHEIAGDIPEYLDPLDGLGWRRAILEYSLTESAASRKQITRMAGYVPPTWDAHFQVVEGLLRSIGMQDAG